MLLKLAHSEGRVPERAFRFSILPEQRNEIGKREKRVGGERALHNFVREVRDDHSEGRVPEKEF